MTPADYATTEPPADHATTVPLGQGSWNTPIIIPYDDELFMEVGAAVASCRRYVIVGIDGSRNIVWARDVHEAIMYRRNGLPTHIKHIELDPIK